MDPKADTVLSKRGRENEADLHKINPPERPSTGSSHPAVTTSTPVPAGSSLTLLEAHPAMAAQPNTLPPSSYPATASPYPVPTGPLLTQPSASPPYLAQARQAAASPASTDAAAPLPSSLDSMREMAIRAERANLLDDRQVYSRIYKPRSDNPPTISPAEYSKYLSILSQTDRDNRTRGVKSSPQSEDGKAPAERLNTNTKLVQASGGKDKSAIEAMHHDFFRAKTTALDSSQATARLSLRLQPQATASAWHTINTHLLGTENSSKGVRAAKVAGPAAVNVQTDSAILYLANTSSSQSAAGHAQAVADELHQRITPASFAQEVPMSMQPLRPGIGYADQHREYSSHGESRALATTYALNTLRNQSDYPNLTSPEREARLTGDVLPQALRDFGVNP